MVDEGFVRHFQAFGFAVARGLFGPAEVAAISREFDGAMAGCPVHITPRDTYETAARGRSVAELAPAATTARVARWRRRGRGDDLPTCPPTPGF